MHRDMFVHQASSLWLWRDTCETPSLVGRDPGRRVREGTGEGNHEGDFCRETSEQEDDEQQDEDDSRVGCRSTRWCAIYWHIQLGLVLLVLQGLLYMVSHSAAWPMDTSLLEMLGVGAGLWEVASGGS